MTFPWAHLADAEVSRLAALPIDQGASQLFDAAKPRASPRDLHELSADCVTIGARRVAWTLDECRTAHAAWKAARAMGRTAEDDAEAADKIPIKVRLAQDLEKAIALGERKAANMISQTLERIEKLGQVRTEVEHSSEDWSRLSDREAAVCVALIRKLHGEPMTADDTAALAGAGL